MNFKFKAYFLIVSILSFIVIAVRSYLVPFNHDETATFFMYVQSGNYMPFYSTIDANNHVLNSFLSNVCFHLFGSSPFSLRLPNLLGFVILIYATYKISNSLQHIGSKVFLTSALLLSFHWLSFYGACRGYGLSMALLAWSMAILINSEFKIQHLKLMGCCLLFQLAISANLILIIVVLLLSGLLMLVQLANKTLFKPANLFIWILHFAAVYYWLSFSFYLQAKGALYYGEGDSYWKTTFVSLVQLVVGYSNPAIMYALVGLFVVTMLLVFYVNRNPNYQIFKLSNLQIIKLTPSLLLAVILSLLIVGFYLMHKLMGVNYPEDRTGLFFYLFFVLLISFTFDKLPTKINTIMLTVASIIIGVHFCYNLNFRKHSLSVYETIPQHFYETLVNEQKKSNERITIGGHRVRELFFGFMNYRNGGYLNPADPTETMQMNCDYYIATKPEEKYYTMYYDVIDTEPDWGLVILKRKEQIKRTLVTEIKDKIINSKDAEFMEVYNVIDSTSHSPKPLLAEVNFDIEQIPVPCAVWVVFQINDSAGQTISYKRYTLQWSGYDNNGKKNLSYSLTSGNLPKATKKILYYFWNINKEPLSIKINSFKLFQLNGNGVEYVAPDIK
ncbi:MAG: hypothetical protein ACYDCN_03330 [Bacteroidia bacterium]